MTRIFVPAIFIPLLFACSQPATHSVTATHQSIDQADQVAAVVITKKNGQSIELNATSTDSAEGLIDAEVNYRSTDVTCGGNACRPKGFSFIKAKAMCYRGQINEACNVYDRAFALALNDYTDGLHQGAEMTGCAANASQISLDYRLYDDYSLLSAPVEVSLIVPPCSESEDARLKTLANNYKSLIGHALYISEGDYPWSPVYSDGPVRESYSESELRKALKIDTSLPVSVAGSESTTEFWITYIDDEYSGSEDAAAYKALKEAMEMDLEDIRLIKVGEEDSGALDLFLIGRTPDGKLIGLRTISIET